MNLLEKIFGKKASVSAAGKKLTPQQINQQWEKARKLGYTDEDRKKAVSIYTGLLGSVDEGSSEFNVCAILRNRAIAYRGLKDYDAALADLAQEQAIARRLGDSLREMQSRSISEETLTWQRQAQVDAEGGEKAARLKSMEEQARGLWREDADFEGAFSALFADLENEDADVRAAAARLLAESPQAIRQVITTYNENLQADPRKASLAGRVLGRKAARGTNDVLHAEIGKMLYGLELSFIPCSCVHCGQLNKGIAAPPSAPWVPYFSQGDAQGGFAVPVLCDQCGQEFFVVWDQEPR